MIDGFPQQIGFNISALFREPEPQGVLQRDCGRGLDAVELFTLLDGIIKHIFRSRHLRRARCCLVNGIVAASRHFEGLDLHGLPLVFALFFCPIALQKNLLHDVQSPTMVALQVKDLATCKLPLHVAGVAVLQLSRSSQ